MQLVERSVGGRNFVVPSYACMSVLRNKIRWFSFRLLSLVSTIFFLPSNGNNGRNHRLILILKQTVVANLELKSKILRVDCCVEFVARIQVSYKLQNTKMNKYFNDFFLDPAICQL